MREELDTSLASNKHIQLCIVEEHYKKFAIQYLQFWVWWKLFFNSNTSWIMVYFLLFVFFSFACIHAFMKSKKSKLCVLAYINTKVIQKALYLQKLYDKASYFFIKLITEKKMTLIYDVCQSSLNIIKHHQTFNDCVIYINE